RPCVGRMPPFVARPMQQERGTRLYAEELAGRRRRQFSVEFPHLNRIAFPGAGHVAIVGGVNQVEDFAVCGGALQLHVFGMSPQERLRCASRSAETEMARR